MERDLGLIRTRDSLLAEQRELSKQKPRGKTDEALISEISRLESNITVAKDDLVGSNLVIFDNLMTSPFVRERASYVSTGLKMNSSILTES